MGIIVSLLAWREEACRDKHAKVVREAAAAEVLR